MSTRRRRGPAASAAAAIVIVALIGALATAPGSAQSPWPWLASSPQTLAVQAVQALLQHYVDPVDPVALLNTAIAALRSLSHLPPDDLPPLSPGTPLALADRIYADRLAHAQAASGRPRAELDQAATSAMLDSLHDSHTYYLPPSDYAEQEAELQGAAAYAGVGILIAQVQDDSGTRWIFAADVFPGSPADAAGVQRFDRIVAVDGHSLENATIPDASSLLRGAPGTTVTLRIDRHGAPVTLTIRRAPITIPAASAHELPGGILWVRLRSFADGAAESVAKLIRAHSGPDAPRGIILDLRGNPGGVLTEASRVAGLFLPTGTPIARITDRDTSDTLRAEGTPAFLTVPLVALIDGQSGSASEIVASALKDAGRATLVGETTAGALGAAITVPLSEGGMSITVARILGARGETIEGVGVAPDLASRLSPQDILRAHDTQLEDAARVVHSAPAASLDRSRTNN
jgi:carboxyl-terminal processing protease